MRRNLPIKRTKKQNLIIAASYDYFGKGMARQEIPAVKAIALFLMNRKKGVKLSEEQKLDMLTIKNNLRDDIYIAALVSEHS